MIKLLHTADLHFGSLTHSRPGPNGIPTSLLSTRDCWRAVVDKALELDRTDLDAVIVAGDVFHTPNPDATSLAFFAAELRRLRECEIPVVIIPGNHDRAPAGRPCVLEIFDDREEQIYVSTRPEIIDTGTARFGTLPSVGMQQLLATEAGTRTELDQRGSDALAMILEGYAQQVVDVVVGHWSLEGAVLGGERDVALVREPMIRAADAEGPWRYLALGHLHRAQQLAFGAYSGSIDRVSFSEEDDQKIALEVTLPDREYAVGEVEVVESTTIELRKHKLPARRFVTIDLTHPEYGTVEFGPGIEGAIVRVLNTPPELVAEVRAKLARQNPAVVYVETARERQERAEVSGIAEAASPLEALEPWLEERVEPELRPRTLKRARELVDEGGQL